MGLAVCLIALLAAKPARQIWPDKVLSTLFTGDIIPVPNCFLEAVFVPAFIGAVATAGGDALVNKPGVANRAFGGVYTVSFTARLAAEFPIFIYRQELLSAVLAFFLDGDILFPSMPFVGSNGRGVSLANPLRILSAFVAILLNAIHGFKFCPADFTDFCGDDAPPPGISITETTELVNQLRAQNLILFSSVSHDALDESPMAYKDSVTILENIRPTAEVLEDIRPVYNFKAGRDIG